MKSQTVDKMKQPAAFDDDTENSKTMSETQLQVNQQRTLSNRAKWIRMVVLAIGYMGSGTAYSVPGPSLIDLEIRTSAPTQEVALMFTLRAAGGLVGSLLAGYLCDVLNMDILLAVVEALAACFITAAPWWQHATALSASVGVAGVGCAMLNVGINFYCVSLWGAGHQPYLLLLSFLNSGAAAAVTPIVRALLLPKTYSSTHLPSIQPDGNITDVTNQTTYALSENGTAASQYSPHEVKVQYAFLVPGVLFALSSLLHAALAASDNCDRQPSFRTKGKKDSKGSPGHPTKLSKWKTVILLISFGLLAGNLGAINETHTMFLFSFLVKGMQWAKLQAAWPLMALQVSFFTAQLLCIGVSKVLKSSTIMGIVQSSMFISTLLMCLPIRTEPAVFWICMILIGLAIGPAGSTMVSWMSSVFGPSGKITSCYFTLVYVARMACSYLLGYLFDNQGPIWFVYMNIITVGVSLIGYVVIIILTEINTNVSKKKSDEFEHEATMKPMLESPVAACDPTNKENGLPL